MAFTHIQGAEGQAGGTTNVVLGSNPTFQNLVCVAVTSAAGGITNCTVADAAGNNYTKTPNSPSTNGLTSVWLFYLLLAPSNANKTITATPTPGGTINVYAEEFGVGGQFANFDVDDADASTGANISSPIYIPNQSSELVFSGAQTASPSISAPTGGGTLGAWTGADGNNGLRASSAEYDLTVTSSQAVQYTNASGVWAAMAMGFFLTDTNPNAIINQGYAAAVQDDMVWGGGDQ